ncbi:MAG: Cys-tRNA(Pro) deacylase [Oscillospiraceae bacterium]|nr:Cys-tRNA(Pro) deacylase [Oscillospiraceae bacterium]
MAECKTNVMRILERNKVPYKAHEYPHGKDPVDGVHVAALLGENPAAVFKTLVLQGADRGYYVFVVPVTHELDLKKAAAAANVKSVRMIPVSSIRAVTGYVRGGCSPLGMKKQFPTILDESARAISHIIVSAGKIGYQIDLAPQDLIRLAGGTFAPITA